MRALLFILLVTISSFPAYAAGLGWAGSTVLSYTRSHGTAVYYFDNSRRVGKYYLWYPGAGTVITGKWTYSEDGTTPLTWRLCLRDGKVNDGCQSLRDFAQGVAQHTKGDVFGLGKARSVPYNLSRSKATIQKIAGRAGVRITGEVINSEDLITRPGGQKGWGEEPFSQKLPEITCESQQALAKQNTLEGKRTAASLYFHGKVMGKPCGKVDYEKALSLTLEINDQSTFRAFIDILRNRASIGNSKAKRALEKFE